MIYTTTEENYIKAIYHLQDTHDKLGTNLLSEEMKTKPASVTDMIKKLEVKKLVHYKKYKGFMLTEQGSRVALTIIRKHRLWEYFLVNKLGFHWDEVHVLAEQLEHITSEELITRLDNYLGNPAFDPHGDPIPDNRGKIKEMNQESLINLPLKKTVTVSAVKNQRPEMLDILDHHCIGIGTKLKITRRFPFDGSIEVIIDKQPAITISSQVAQNIYCII